MCTKKLEENGHILRALARAKYMVKSVFWFVFSMFCIRMYYSIHYALCCWLCWMYCMCSFSCIRFSKFLKAFLTGKKLFVYVNTVHYHLAEMPRSYFICPNNIENGCWFCRGIKSYAAVCMIFTFRLGEYKQWCHLVEL